MPYATTGIIKENKTINKDSYGMRIYCPSIAHEAEPGQFVQVKTSSSGLPLLNKPISISAIDGDVIELVYQVVGPGTSQLAEKLPESSIVLIGPLGKGFNVPLNERVLLVGGGIGVAPLQFLMEALKEKDNKVDAILGFNTMSDIILEDFFKNHAVNLVVTTMDGSCGLKGHACTPLSQNINLTQYDHVYACGPEPMLKALVHHCQQANIPSSISMESYMACGFGVCLGCVQGIKKADGRMKNERVCLEGPVFSGQEVVFND